MNARSGSKVRPTLGSLTALVLLGGVLAACSLGGGSVLGDCSGDVDGPDSYVLGASAAYGIPVVSCGNPGGGADEDQYVYGALLTDVTVTCVLEDDGGGGGASVSVYVARAGEDDGDFLGAVDCLGGSGVDFQVDLGDPVVQDGDRLLIEVFHEGAGSRARVNTSLA